MAKYCLQNFKLIQSHRSITVLAFLRCHAFILHNHALVAVAIGLWSYRSDSPRVGVDRGVRY